MRTDVVAWLRGLPEMIAARACLVKIGDESWDGADYVQRLTPPPGSRQAEPHERRSIYLVGATPKGYRGDDRVCYPMDGAEWYISGYWDGYGRDRSAKHHPFGPNFMLCSWDESDGQKIDHHEPRPYRRIPMAISYEQKGCC